MKRNFIILTALIFVTLVAAVPSQLFAQSDDNIPTTFRNNHFYAESLRQANLAKLAYDSGDFDGSVSYSEEAIRYANLSDEYISLRLKMWEADKAILAAAKRLDYASSINAVSRFPSEYNMARETLQEARSYRAGEMWDEAIDSANRVLAILALIDGSGGRADGTRGDDDSTLPSQYIVRTWQDFKDCFWNIAARPWVYDDPEQWKLLYNANKSKLPDSENPDLVHPGTVLDIPSLKGETRNGTWDASNR